MAKSRNVPGVEIPADYGTAKGNSLESGLPSRQILGQVEQRTPPGSGDSFGVEQFTRGKIRSAAESRLSDMDRSAPPPLRRVDGSYGQSDSNH